MSGFSTSSVKVLSIYTASGLKLDELARCDTRRHFVATTKCLNTVDQQVNRGIILIETFGARGLP